MPEDSIETLIGKRVKFRNYGTEEVGTVTGFHWMPAEPGYNPQLTANVVSIDGCLHNMFVHLLRVMPEEPEEPEEPEVEATRGTADFSVTFHRQAERYVFNIRPGDSDAFEKSGGADNWNSLITLIRRNLGELGYLPPSTVTASFSPPQPRDNPGAVDNRGLREGETLEYCGYTLKPRHPSFGARIEGMWITKAGINVAPGGIWARTISQGKKMIAAIILAKRLDEEARGMGGSLGHNQHDDIHTFHLLMELMR